MDDDEVKRMVIVPLGKVVDCYDPLARLARQPVQAQLAQKIRKLVKFVTPLHKDYIDRRDAIASKMGTPAPQGGWHLEPGPLAEFNKKNGTILSENIQIPTEFEFTAAEMDQMKISATDLDSMIFLIPDLRK